MYPGVSTQYELPDGSFSWIRKSPMSPVNVTPPSSGLEISAPGIEMNSQVPTASAEKKTPATDQRRSKSLIYSRTRRQDKGREERALDELIYRENWKDLAKFAFRERVAPKKKHQLTGATRGHTIGRLCRPLESWNYLLKWKI